MKRHRLGDTHSQTTLAAATLYGQNGSQASLHVYSCPGLYCFLHVYSCPGSYCWPVQSPHRMPALVLCFVHAARLHWLQRILTLFTFW